MWKFLSPLGCFTTRDFSSRSKKRKKEKTKGNNDTRTNQKPAQEILLLPLSGAPSSKYRADPQELKLPGLYL